MRKYILIFLDRQGEELQRKEVEAKNLKEAKFHAKKIFSNSMLNDLHKIEVKTI